MLVECPQELRTSRLLLTRIQPADLNDLVAFYADREVTATLGGQRTSEWVAEYLYKQIDHWNENGFGYWTIRDLETGRFAGRGGLRFARIGERDEVEVGYGLLADFWGRGLATEVARESVRVGFENLFLPEVVSFTQPTNLASKRVMEKAGFRYDRDIVYANLPHVLYRLTAEDWRGIAP